MIENYKQQTQTKLIASHFKGTPELNNEYGSLNNLLKKVLTEYYNPQEVLEVSRTLDTYNIFLNINHGFLKDQVIELRHASFDTFNTQYRILNTTLNSIEIIALSENVLEPQPDKSLEVLGAPLGYSVVYENLEDGVLCIKNTSTNSPAILRSIDKLPPNSYENSWSKFARVTIGQNIDGQGMFIDNIKAPYHPDHPYAEEVGNGVSGAAGIHGFAKWRYSLGNNYESTEHRPPAGTFPTKWRIVGDSNTFYLMIHTTGLTDLSYSYDLVGYGNYLTYNTEESSNVCLQATQGFYGSNTNPDYSATRPRNYFGALNYPYSGFILTDVFGSHKTGYNYFKNIGEYLSTDNKNHPWKSFNIETVNFESGLWSAGNLIIKDHLNYIRGEHRGIKILYGKNNLPDMNITSQGILSLEVQEPRISSDFAKTTMLFTLENWE